MTVRDAHGAPATVPFWLGEAPGRTAELSAEAVAICARRFGRHARTSRSDDRPWPWLTNELRRHRVGRAAGRELRRGARRGDRACAVETQVVFERFFDESGGMQLVIHAPFGARINRAWGLALRKCFCRTFDFELQASADDNGIVLSIGPQHSFPIERLFDFLESAQRRATAHAGAARGADVPDPLAMERDAGAGGAAAAGRQKGAATTAAVPRRRFAHGRVSAADRLLRAPAGEPRTARSSAGSADGSRLPARGDGPRRLARCTARH